MSPRLRSSLARTLAVVALGLIAPANAFTDDAPKPAPSAAPAAAPASRFKVPDGGVDELRRFLLELKLNRPRSRDEFKEILTATRTAAERILALEKNADSPAAQEALVESLSAGARLAGDWDEATQRKELGRIEAYLAKREVGRTELAIAMSFAQALEFAATPTPVAVEAYEKLSELVVRHGDSRAKQQGAAMAGAARRLKLVGNPLELAGTKLDGAPFELSSLKGKVVLVDFWATWCGPCIAEHPNVKKNYEKYREAGFEVVAVSIDEDREALETFVKEKETPWITLHEKEAGGKNPATDKYGILSIPAMFLVDREGKVLSLRARGAELDRLLAEQFPDVK